MNDKKKEALQDKSALENLLSKSPSQQTNDRVRGLRQEVLSAGATYDGGAVMSLHNGT